MITERDKPRPFYQTRLAIVFLLIVIAFTALTTHALIRGVRRKENRERAIAKIQEVGGIVIFSTTNFTPFPYTQIKKPTYVQFVQVDMEALNLGALHDLPEIKTVQLTGSRHVDSAMEEVAKLPNLSILILDGSDISSKGLAKFTNHPTLVSLSLNQTTLDDSAMEVVASIPNLVYLYLGSAKFDLAQLNELANHQRLAVLSLVGTGVTEAELAVLKANESLQIMTDPASPF